MTQSLFTSSKRREFYKKISAGLLMVSLNLSMGGLGVIFTANVAHAAVSTPIVTESFGTITTNTVTGWAETEGNGQDARLETSTDRPGSPTKGHLRLRNDASVVRTISTVGYSNIILSYYWRGDSQAESSDHLKIYWRTLPSGEFQEVGDHSLTGQTSSWSSVVSVTLPTSANNTSIEVKILGATNSSSEEARVDDVNVSGTPIMHTLSVSNAGTGTGSVSSTPSGISCGATCTTSFTDGTSVMLTATPSVGSTHTSWTGCDSTSGNTCTVLMNSARSVSATYSINTYTLTTNTVGSGKIESEGISCGMGGSDCDESYPYNTEVLLTETPGAGYEFLGWGGACSGTATTCSVVMSEVKEVSASFRAIIDTPPTDSCEARTSTETIVSDVSNTTAPGVFAVATSVHPAWTASALMPEATWIWNAEVAGGISDEAVTFTKTFSVSGTPTSASIIVAADNYYEASLNGTEFGSTTDEFNYSSSGADTYNVSSLLQSGTNTLTIIVHNKGVGSQSNPAGLLYKLTVNKNACVPEDPTPAPVCDSNVNLLDNGDFEAPSVGLSSWDIIPFTNAALKWLGAFVNPQESGRLGLELQASVAGSPAQGTQHAELDGDHPLKIWQNIATIPGYDYALTFKYSPRPGTVLGNNVLEVQKDDVLLGAQISRGSTSGDTEWSDETRTFTAVGTTTKIAFADVSATDDSLGTYIDGARLVCVGVHVEEPIDMCPNIQGVQETIPADLELVDGQCIAVEVIDQCINLLGAQTEVPEGYTRDEEGMCYADKPKDVCENIEGTQEVVPEGFESDSQGACYPVESIDVCSNIEGVQEEVPSGMTATEGICTTIVTPPTTDTGGSTDFDYPGCTNPEALNFNRLANKDDGSCTFPTPPTVPTGSTGELPAEGEVLGAATTTEALPAGCSEYLRDYLKIGKKNDSEQVKLLQTFLNETMDAKLPVTGFFGNLTKNWVKKFQKKYHAEIIKPWLDAGYKGPSMSEGTGNVYKTTKHQINLMKCAELQVPAPDLSSDI